MKPRLLALLAFAHAATVAAQPLPFDLAGDAGARLTWSRTLAAPGDDWINDLVPLERGRYLAVGFLDRGEGRDWRAVAATFGADGTESGRHEYGAGGGVDAFWSGRESRDGGRLFAGFTTRLGVGGIDAWVLLADADGSVRHERSFGGPGYDRFTSFAPSGDGFLFIGHSQLAGEERRRLFAVRTDATGARLWERIIEGAESISPLYVEPAGDGGFIVAGGISSDRDPDILVMKLDQAGRELWRRRVGTDSAADVNHGLVVRPDGSILVVGYSRSWGARDNDILAATLSPSGEVLRQEMLGGAGDDRPILAKLDDQNRVWVVGYTRSAGAGGWDLLLARLDRTGRFEPGVITLGGPEDDNGTAILPLGGDAVLVAGYSRGLAGGGEDAFIARIDGVGLRAPRPDFVARPVG